MNARVSILAFFAGAQLHAARPLPETFVDAAQGQDRFARERQFFAPQNPYRGVSTESVPTLYPGESADVGPQYLLLRPHRRRTWIEGGIDAQYFYSSNVFLTERDKVDTGVLLTTVTAGLAPPPFEFAGGEAALHIGYRHARYNYGLDSSANQLNNIDFDVGTIYAGSRFTFHDDWHGWLGLEYNRYLSSERDWSEFYTELLPQWGVERVLHFNDKNAFSLSYYGGYHFTHSDPDPTTHGNDRLDTILSLAYNYTVVTGVILQPYYRFQHSYYSQSGSRHDVFNVVGLTVAYFFNEWASVRLFTSFEARESNDPRVQDYRKWDSGGGVTLAVRF